MLKYMGNTTSAYDGKSLSQTNLASSTYLKTEANGATTWTSKAMDTGIDKWRGVGFYIQVGSPSAATVKGAFLTTMGMNHKPIAVDTVEFAGGAHYNGHPVNKLIGHWLAGYRYDNSAETVGFMDPSTTYFSGAAPYFTVNTTSFTNTYLQSNGILY